MSALKCSIVAALGFAWATGAFSAAGNAANHWTEARIPGTSEDALTLGRDLDGDGDPDEITIRLEVIEVTEEVYPGEFVKFWVFAPEGQGMTRVRSPKLRRAHILKYNMVFLCRFYAHNPAVHSNI